MEKDLKVDAKVVKDISLNRISQSNGIKCKKHRKHK